MLEMTIETAIIELNRLKSQERMDIDRKRLTAAIDTLVAMARLTIKRKPKKQKHGNIYISWTSYSCPKCDRILCDHQSFCDKCSQALDWSDEE